MSLALFFVDCILGFCLVGFTDGFGARNTRGSEIAAMAGLGAIVFLNYGLWGWF